MCVENVCIFRTNLTKKCKSEFTVAYSNAVELRESRNFLLAFIFEENSDDE